MNRFAYNQLLQWKNSGSSRFLILGGITKVGKTTLVNEFGKNEFKTYYCWDSNLDSFEIFNEQVSLLPAKSLVIADNLTGCKDQLLEINKLTIKFPQLHFIAIDSFIKEGRGDTQPLAVKYLVLFPLTFDEFLYNVNINLYKQLATLNSVNDITNDFNDKIIRLFHDYLTVGGMPSVINQYINHGLVFSEIRQEQNLIIEYILTSLSKYYKTTEYKNLLKIIKLIYPNLIKDNRKFKMSDISESTRYTSFKKYFSILNNLNLIYISRGIKDDSLQYDEKSMVLYFCDVGLLGALAVVPEALYNVKNLYTEPVSVGLCNNFVANELFSTTSLDIYTWAHNMSKIEFVLVKQNSITAVEAKTDLSGKLKSLDSFGNYFKNSSKIRLNTNIPGKNIEIKSYPIYLIKSLYRKFISLN